MNMPTHRFKLTVALCDLVATREHRVPDTALDEVLAIFYAHHVSGEELIQAGALTVQSRQLDQKRLRKIKIETLETELDLLNRLIDLILELDPDILTGWDVQLSSWGYLEARSNTHGKRFRTFVVNDTGVYPTTKVLHSPTSSLALLLNTLVLHQLTIGGCERLQHLQ